jgi:hypothetical protein
MMWREDNSQTATGLWRRGNMKATKFTFVHRVTAFGPSAVLLLTMLVLIAGATTTAAQTNVFVPGTASGYFGNPQDRAVPFVPAITVSGPGTITVTYVSGTVTDCCGIDTGPNGVTYTCGYQCQFPLQEANGVASRKTSREDALIGVFVSQSRVQRAGFNALDGTKNVTKVGIKPGYLFFIGTGKTFSVSQAGTLFLGINDIYVGDNGGGFNVTVTGP